MLTPVGFGVPSADDFEREWARRNYLSYCKYVHRGFWIPGRHHVLIAEHLDRVVRGEEKRLMFWMPPRHGKSMEITETFPSYFLGKHPDKRVMEVSYNNDFAKKFGRRNRNKIKSYGLDLFGIHLSFENHSVSNWELAGHSGGMISIGLNGAATGEGADLLLIDDPIKNRADAESVLKRDKLFTEYQATFSTRVHSGGAIIIVMTRWHEDDICGRLLNPEFGSIDDWTVVKLPAICEDEDDPLGRKIGEPLWPEHGYDLDWINKKKIAVGSYTFAGLYQQRPAPMDGGILHADKIRFYTALPERFDEIVQSWDCTFKAVDSSDYVAGHIWGRRKADFYLLDRVHQRMGIVDTMKSIRLMHERWPKARAIYIEDKANGSAVIEMMQREIPGIIPVEPEGGKIVRAQAIAPYVESGNVYLPHMSIAPWSGEVVKEIKLFPNGLHDDDVDAMTQAINKLSGSGTVSAPQSVPKAASYWRS